MKTNTNLSRAGIVSLGLMLLAGTVSAQGVRDLQWYEMDSGATSGGLFHISGSSLDRLFIAHDNDADIRQYNTGAGSWDVVQGWTDHLVGNANWDGVTRISGIAAYGDEIYVVTNHNVSHGWVGYSADGGLTWEDIDKGVTRAGPSIVFAPDGSKALLANTHAAMTVLDGNSATTTENAAGLSSSSVAVAGSIGSDGSMWFVRAGLAVGRNPASGSGWADATGTGLAHTGSMNAYGIQAIDEDTAFLASANNHWVYYTTDGGQNWIEFGHFANDPPGTNEFRYPGGHARGLYADSADSVWAYGSFDPIYHYDGSTWKEITLPDNTVSMRAMTKVEDYYFVVGNDGKMYTTIPEPSTLMLLGSAAGLVLWRRRRVGRAKAEA